MKNTLKKVASSLLSMAMILTVALVPSSAEDSLSIAYDKATKTITVTIDENAKGDLEVDLSQLLTNGATFVMPGDSLKGAKLKFVNNSKYSYQYKDQSLELGTSYIKTANNTYGYLTGFKGYDQKPLVYGEVGYITQSQALKALNNGNNLSLEQILNINQILKDYNRKYDCENPLTQYFYDYYNVTSFDQLSEKAKVDIIGKTYNDGGSLQVGGSVSFKSTYTTTNEAIDRLNKLQENSSQLGIFYKNTLSRSGTSISSRVKHTEEPLIQFTYQYFYENCAAITFGQDDDPLTGSTVKKYSFKSYSDKTSEGYKNANKIFSKLFLESKETQTDPFLDGVYMFFDAYNLGNAYQKYENSYGGIIVLEQAISSGDVTVSKTIDLNGYETNDTPTFIFKLTDVNGKEYYQTMTLKEGQTKQSVKFENIPLGQYTVEELATIRYVTVGSTIQEGKLTKEDYQQSLSFTNKKEKDNDFSDTGVVINSFKKVDGKIEISQNYQGE